MMKRFLTVLLIVVTAFFLTSGSASAIKFDFKGDYKVVDADDGVYKLTFESGYDWMGNIMPDSGLISNTFSPDNDGLFSDKTPEFVELSTLYFTNDYSFTQTTYVDGFKVWDYNNGVSNLLFEADLNVSALADMGTTGAINPGFGLNLTNITAGSDYLAGSSAIVDGFLNPYGGATQITLQWGGEGQFIPTSTGTYSATASPIPEPAIMLLLGSSLISMGMLGRRKKFVNR